MSLSVNPRSRFTPSLMKRDLLERLFVAREKTLDRVMDRVTAAVSRDERNHTLLVGPRGSGKTHLVSLAYHRVRDLRDAGAAVQVAWLPEDPWTIVTYRHLLRAIAERQEPSLEEPLPDTASELEALLVRSAGRRGPIVVIAENLDQILEALGNEGQQQLRHLLQAHRPFVLIATSTRIDRALSDQAEPFYGFFTTTRLEPFDVDQATAMLSAIAAENADEQLLAYLLSDEGQKRLRTIAHLAGGQPRIWALLASALTIGGLGELIELLLTRFDDLTPYYQEQLGRLSPQQRLAVAELAEADRPVNVGQLATRIGLDQRSLGKTLSELVERGWVTPTQSPLTAQLDRRRTYYELAEPLARISFQIKETRGEPLRLIVEFLKHWFDPADLHGTTEAVSTEYVALAVAGQEHDAVVAVTRRLRRLPVTRAPAIGLLGEIDDALAAFGSGDPEPLLCLPTPVRNALESELSESDLAATRARVHIAAWEEFGDVPHPAMAAWVNRSGAWLDSSGTEERAVPQMILISWLANAWRFDEATEALATACDMLGTEHPGTLAARNNVARAYESAGRASEAIPHFEEALAASRRVHGSEHPGTLTVWNNLASAYESAGRAVEAIPVFEELLTVSERVLGAEHPDILTSRDNLASTFGSAGRLPDAIALFEENLAARARLLGPEHPDTLVSRNNLANAYLYADRVDEAVAILEETLVASERVLGTHHPYTLTARNNLASAYQSEGRLTDAIPILERNLADREQLLGSEHPQTLTARNNLAGAYQSADRLTEAIPMLEENLEERTRLLGPEHPHTLTARNNLAGAYQSAGRLTDAIPMFEQTVTDCERVLGPDHPNTVMTRENLADARRHLLRRGDSPE